MQIRLRPAAVAGVFYPDTAAALTHTLAELLAAAPAGVLRRAKAVIAPHAGYIYSGPVAASLYAPLAGLRDSVRRVVLLGPAHRAALEGLALPACDAFATPLGNVPIDADGVAAIAALPQVSVNDLAHAREHSLEVQLPFLQTVLEEFSLVPLVVGRARPESVAEVIEKLWGGNETLIVVSSDLSHYLNGTEAQRLDTRTARQIAMLDPSLAQEQACGATPVNGLLLAARAHGLRVQIIDLRNSGDIAGDHSRVVGYGAFALVGEDGHGH